MSAIQQQGRYSRHRRGHLSVHQGLNGKEERDFPRATTLAILSAVQGRTEEHVEAIGSRKIHTKN